MDESAWNRLAVAVERYSPGVDARILRSEDDKEDLMAIEVRPKSRSFRDLPLSLLDTHSLLLLFSSRTENIDVVVVDRSGGNRQQLGLEVNEETAVRVARIISQHLLLPPSKPVVAANTHIRPTVLSSRKNGSVATRNVAVRRKVWRPEPMKEESTRKLRLKLAAAPAAEEEEEDDLEEVAASSASDNALTCHLCGKVMKKSSMIKHIKFVHDGEKYRSHACLECGKAYKTKAALTKHTYSHTGERPFCCSFCGKTYRENDSWINCQRRCSGNFRHRCKVCGKQFNRKFRLAAHLRVHSGEKPFRCPRCPYQCSRKDNLQTHAKKAHKLTIHEVAAEAEDM